MTKTAKRSKKPETDDVTSGSKQTYNTALLTARSSDFITTAKSDSEVMYRQRAAMTSRSDSELVGHMSRTSRRRKVEMTQTLDYTSYDEDDPDDFYVDDDNVSLGGHGQTVTSDDKNSDTDSAKTRKKFGSPSSTILLFQQSLTSLL